MAEDKETSVVTELWAGVTIGDASVAGLLGPYHQRKVFPYQISELGRMARGRTGSSQSQSRVATA